MRERLKLVDYCYKYGVNWNQREWQQPHEILSIRRRQHLCLSRYGRIDIRYWDDLTVREMLDYVQSLNELLAEEGDVSGTMETRG